MALQWEFRGPRGDGSPLTPEKHPWKNRWVRVPRAGYPGHGGRLGNG
jgi:hypothetical protein